MAADFWRSSHGCVIPAYLVAQFPHRTDLVNSNHWLFDRRAIAAARATDLKYASAQELAWISIWSANAIHKLAKRLNLKQQVTATAIVYFRRFYLKNSYCETDLPLVAAACVYVATKAEETAMHIKVIVTEARATFGEYNITNFPSDATKLAEMEFYLMEDLEFHLIIFHPYRSLVHMTGRDTGPPAIRETMLDMDDNSLQMAWFVLNDTYRTDLCLLYPPHIIAIAAIYLSLSLHTPASLLGKADSTAPAGQSDTKITVPDEARSKPSTNPNSPVGSPTGTSFSKSTTNPSLPRGKVDPVTFLASLNVQMHHVMEVIQEMLSLYSLWKSYEDVVPTAPGVGGAPGQRQTPDPIGGTIGPTKPMSPMLVGLSNPAAAPGAGDERVVQILTRMKQNRDMDIAHPAHGGAPR